MTSSRRKRRDFDGVYYMGVHNRSGDPRPPVIQALIQWSSDSKSAQCAAESLSGGGV